MTNTRQAFERWFTQNDSTPEMAARAVRRDDRGRYVLMQAHTAWETWQAGYAQARAELIAELKPYGYHIYSEETGNGILFAPADMASEVSEILRANSGLAYRTLAAIPTKERT